ncbi:MAG: choice-of-anchor B family protein [Saprospiraceae bacterium]|nr:choice-of-anchor B family protein [Saprospiraceae bacterium]
MKIQIFTLFMAMVAAFGGQAQDYNMAVRSSMEFPGQTLANVWGYAQDGKEYALLGGQLGLIVVDVTDPDNPFQITQVPGPNNLWKELKTYQHYAYVTTEGGPVQVVDLSPLPSPNLPVNVYAGDGAIANAIGNVHALHVDVTKGYLYLYGSGAGVTGTGGALVCDLNPDPFHPHFVGEFQTLGYIHDGFVDNDTLYGSHIYTGEMSVVDMSDKQNPVALGTVLTPSAFVHNTWPTDDRQTVLTTDEVDGAYLTSFDVSDPTDIQELDRFQCTPGSGSVPHNTHILNDYAITSWYTDGVSIVDASRPSNLVQVAHFDTYPEQSGPGYNGCWGAYPFLPSGNIITTNIPVAFAVGDGKMFVLTPNYNRACWLEGKVTDGLTGQPLSGVTIDIDSPDPLTATSTGLLGNYTTGQTTPGNFPVSFSLSGYESNNVNVILANGAVTVLDVQLYPPGTSGTDWVDNDEVELKASPSMFSNETTIEFKLPGNVPDAELNLTDAVGHLVWSKHVDKLTTAVQFNEAIAIGNYFLTLKVGGKQTKALQVTKVD